MSGSGTALSALQSSVLNELGIDVWVPRATVPGVADEQADSWQELNDSIRACTRCDLHKSRTQAVCGTGDETADWLILGEAPGAAEDKQGEPFVGSAGQLLNEMLRAAGLNREQVYITNILKCHPPENRDPKADEVEQCIPFLQQQITRLQPKLILVVGRIAAHKLLQVETPIGELRGQVHSYGSANIPVIVTYHPAYLLRSPGHKPKVWEDLLLAMDVANGGASGGDAGESG
jgi:uracil-DNA glycosylase family 4